MYINIGISIGLANSREVSGGIVPLSNGLATTNSSGNGVASLSVSNASGGTAPYTYQWYRSTTAGFTPGAGNILSGKTSQTLSDTGLTNGTTYYYKNVATDSAGNTAISNQTSATPASAAALAAGTASTSSSGSNVASVVVANATGGTGPYTYQWQRSTNSGSGFVNVAGATSQTLNDSGLTNGTTYYYQNIVTDSVGATSTSNQTSATPAASGGSAPALQFNKASNSQYIMVI